MIKIQQSYIQLYSVTQYDSFTFKQLIIVETFSLLIRMFSDMSE